jgi:uncharacterized RDD family membrane protein YckC
MMYDSIVVMAIWIVVGFIVLAMFGIPNAQTVEEGRVVMNPWYRHALLLAMLISSFTFFAGFWMASGQTLGMQAWRLRIQNPDGSSISLRQCLIRFTLAPFSLLLLGGGYLFMYFNPGRETLHDRLSGSQVVWVSPISRQ